MAANLVRPLPNPFELVRDQGFAPAARRELEVFGAPVELLLLPERKRRAGRPGFREPFRPAVAERIIAEEALWELENVTLTPNKFPFADRHAVLWSRQPSREPTMNLLVTAFSMVAEHGGMMMGNCIGSAASVQRAHVHLVPLDLQFLDRLRRAPASELARLIDAPDGQLEVTQVDHVPFIAVTLEGDPMHRARATLRLLEIRTTATFNLIATAERTWVIPRGQETPAPHFPYALGAAELSGRWCFGDEKPFRSARSTSLEHALILAGIRSP